MSKKARLRKAERRHFESWWRQQHGKYRGLADMLQDLFDKKGWDDYTIDTGCITFNRGTKVYKVFNMPKLYRGRSIYGYWHPVNNNGSVYLRIMLIKQARYLYDRLKKELTELWKLEQQSISTGTTSKRKRNTSARA